MGIFSKNYESAGSGIAKDAPKKEGVALFFDIFGRKIWNLMTLNLMYMSFFLPLILILPLIYACGEKYSDVSLILTVVLAIIFMILIGPATAGMIKVIRCFVLGKHTFICLSRTKIMAKHHASKIQNRKINFEKHRKAINRRY